MMTSNLYSAEQVAEMLNLHVKTVRRYVRDGRLKAKRIGKEYRITRADLEAFAGEVRPAEKEVPRTRHGVAERAKRRRRLPARGLDLLPGAGEAARDDHREPGVDLRADSDD